MAIPHQRFRENRTRLKLFSLALVLLFGLVRIASGQADQGTITGVIQDPSGAAIGNASVTLTNDDTGQVLKSNSNGSGVYFLLADQDRQLQGNRQFAGLRNHHADWPDNSACSSSLTLLSR